MIWAVCAAAAVFFALSLFACWLAGLVGLAEGMSEAESIRVEKPRVAAVGCGGPVASASLIRLEHNDLIYPVADIWEAIEVSRLLEGIHATDAATAAESSGLCARNREASAGSVSPVTMEVNDDR